MPPRRLGLPRRAILKSGLAGFAALMSRGLVGCGSDETAPPSDPPPGTPPSGVAGGDEFSFSPIAKKPLKSNIAAIGPLGEPDGNGVRVPEGYTARIVAETNKPPAAGKPYLWHGAPDGGATFPTADGGWIYVSNSELPLSGGVGALRFDGDGAIVDAYRILDKTNINCAGGPTPWATWLSCEEIYTGQVHECDPRGELPAVVRPALGKFKHEAVTIDPVRHHVYLTEDEPDGVFYRFTPDGLNKHGFANLAAGKLEVAKVDGDAVTWHELPDPRFEKETPTRQQVAEATHFDGSEGIWWHAGVVYFTTKGDGRVWAYDTAAAKLKVLYDSKTAADPILTGVDNVTVSASGDVLVAEDGGSMQVVAILPTGELKALVEIVGHDKSEITGPAFDPSGTRLYFSSQRGPNGGVTYEVRGPFHVPAT